MERRPPVEDHSQNDRRIKQDDSSDYYLEMGLVADKKTIAFHGSRKTKSFLLMLANLVCALFAVQGHVTKSDHVNHKNRW